MGMNVGEGRPQGTSAWGQRGDDAEELEGGE